MDLKKKLEQRKRQSHAAAIFLSKLQERKGTEAKGIARLIINSLGKIKLLNINTFVSES